MKLEVGNECSQQCNQLYLHYKATKKCWCSPPGNELMEDRGFTVEKYLTPLGVKLITPSFLKWRSQFNEQ